MSYQPKWGIWEFSPNSTPFWFCAVNGLIFCCHGLLLIDTIVFIFVTPVSTSLVLKSFFKHLQVLISLIAMQLLFMWSLDTPSSNLSSPPVIFPRLHSLVILVSLLLLFVQKDLSSTMVTFVFSMIPTLLSQVVRKNSLFFINYCATYPSTMFNALSMTARLSMFQPILPILSRLIQNYDANDTKYLNVPLSSFTAPLDLWLRLKLICLTLPATFQNPTFPWFSNTIISNLVTMSHVTTMSLMSAVIVQTPMSYHILS